MSAQAADQAKREEADAALVLAGAGTRKTAAIIDKIIHLVHNLRMTSEKVLAPAFQPPFSPITITPNTGPESRNRQQGP